MSSLPFAASNSTLLVDTPERTLPAASSTQPVSPKKNYLVGLNALRAVAALSVCLFHYTGATLPKLIVPAAKSFFAPGYLGVDIFFVISGFIIPYSLVGKNYQAAAVLPYLRKRAVRIVPPAYLSLLLILGQWVIIDKFISHGTRYTGSLSGEQLLHNLLFTVPFTNHSWVNTVFWTLTIEFQFYLFIGLLFNPLFSRSLGWFAALYLAAAALSLLPYTQLIGFLSYSPLFALGGVALQWQRRRISSTAYIAGLLVFSGLVFWRFGAVAALVGLATAVAINTLTVHIPVLSFIGKISYALYLTHGLVGTTAEFLLIKLFPAPSAAGKLGLTAICLLLAIAAAYVFYRLVEEPFMRLASRSRS